MTAGPGAIGVLRGGPWPRRTGQAIAAGRVVLGLVALVAPELPGRAWIGRSAAGRAPAVVLRGLGARDVALGLGALRASSGDDRTHWVALGALADLGDAASTIAGFGSLPRRTRWLVLGACSGAAAAGGMAALLSRGAGASPRAEPAGAVGAPPPVCHTGDLGGRSSAG